MSITCRVGYEVLRVQFSMLGLGQTSIREFVYKSSRAGELRLMIQILHYP